MRARQRGTDILSTNTHTRTLTRRRHDVHEDITATLQTYRSTDSDIRVPGKTESANTCDRREGMKKCDCPPGVIAIPPIASNSGGSKSSEAPGLPLIGSEKSRRRLVRELYTAPDVGTVKDTS
jgi:hypothetical protein